MLFVGRKIDMQTCVRAPSKAEVQFAASCAAAVATRRKRAITEVASAKGKLDSEAARRLDEVRNLFGARSIEAQELPRPVLVESK
jgi:hypothetical protein